MKNCSVCKKSKPVSEYDVHKNTGIMSFCKDCRRDKRKAYYQNNKDAEKKKAAEWSSKNREKHRAYYKKYYKNNTEKEYMRSRNKDKIVKSRTPLWADLDKIKEFYKEAKRLSELTGIPFHVDHIIPIQGKLVSGLACSHKLTSYSCILKFKQV